MERVTGIDAGFLYMETPTVHMHTLKIAVLEPIAGAEPYGFERLRDELQALLPLLPPFRRRVVEIPGGFHHPLWVEDPDFRIERHVFRTTASPPGGDRELDAAVSRIASTPLDRSKPLWELWVVEGLADGCVATVAKIHHAVADGVAAAELLANVLQTGGPGSRHLEDRWTPDVIPSRARMLRDAWGEHLQQLRRLPSLLRRTIGNLRAAGALRRTTAVPPPFPMRDAPPTPLNGALTAARAFASTSLALADVKAVRAAFGVTINDVLMALVAGALRRHLAARQALPAISLTASIPVATDAPGTHRLTGNRVSNMFASLRTDIADPVARVRAIHDAMLSAKALHGALGPHLLEDWTAYAPPRPFASLVRLYARWRLADHLRPPINAIVSTVAGPREPLFANGMRLRGLFSVGPLVEGVGVNVTSWSYVDRMNVGVICCPGHLPDPHVVTDGMRRELTTLLQAAHDKVPSVPAASGGRS